MKDSSKLFDSEILSSVSNSQIGMIHNISYSVHVYSITSLPPLPEGSDSLGAIAAYVLDVSHKWFHLGLSLGLRYPTLKNIEASHSHEGVEGHMTSVLQRWLRGVSIENTAASGCTRGVPSWRALALALDSPLVKEQFRLHAKYRATTLISH